MLLISLGKLAATGPVRRLCSHCRPQFAGKFARPLSLAPLSERPDVRSDRLRRSAGRHALDQLGAGLQRPGQQRQHLGPGALARRSPADRLRRGTGHQHPPGMPSTRPAPAGSGPARPTGSTTAPGPRPLYGYYPPAKHARAAKDRGPTHPRQGEPGGPRPPGGVHDDAPDWCDQGRPPDATGERRGKVSCPSCSTAAAVRRQIRPVSVLGAPSQNGQMPRADSPAAAFPGGQQHTPTGRPACPDPAHTTRPALPPLSCPDGRSPARGRAGGMHRGLQVGPSAHDSQASTRRKGGPIRRPGTGSPRHLAAACPGSRPMPASSAGAVPRTRFGCTRAPAHRARHGPVVPL